MSVEDRSRRETAAGVSRRPEQGTAFSPCADVGRRDLAAVIEAYHRGLLPHPVKVLLVTRKSAVRKSPARAHRTSCSRLCLIQRTVRWNMIWSRSTMWCRRRGRRATCWPSAPMRRTGLKMFRRPTNRRSWTGADSSRAPLRGVRQRADRERPAGENPVLGRVARRFAAVAAHHRRRTGPSAYFVARVRPARKQLAVAHLVPHLHRQRDGLAELPATDPQRWQLLVHASDAFRIGTSEPVNAQDHFAPMQGVQPLKVETNANEIVFGDTFKLKGRIALKIAGTNETAMPWALLDDAESNIKPRDELKFGKFSGVGHGGRRTWNCGGTSRQLRWPCCCSKW